MKTDKKDIITIPCTFKTEKPLSLPKKQSKGSAGIDLMNTGDDVLINPKETKYIQTSFSVAIPDGYVGMVFARSSLGFKFKCTLTNSVGIIDSDYRGEIGLAITNLGTDPKLIEHGERVAQLLILQLPQVTYEEVNSLDSTERGTQGFGSTGTK